MQPGMSGRFGGGLRRTRGRGQRGGTAVPYYANVWNQYGAYPSAVGGGLRTTRQQRRSRSQRRSRQ